MRVCGLAAALDRRADQAAVFGPAAVVVADLLVTEEVLQDEPGVRAALADPAIRDGLLRAVEALGPVDRAELIRGFEPAVLGDRGRPRDVRRPLDVAGTLRAFLREVLRGDELAAELLGVAHVDELLPVLRDRLQDVLAERPARRLAARGPAPR